MNTLQLYVNDERVELFSDETINVTSSIQNAKDISKIFTDFSKDFTIPATAQNNKIFKHYYNYDIVDGFDARIRQDALLQINHYKFRKGKVALMGVNMKNNNPSSYRIVFYGSTVTLPDLFGDDVLPDVLELNDYNHEYNAAQVKLGLTDSLVDGNIVYPLLTHSKRLYYDSSSYPTVLIRATVEQATGTSKPGNKVVAYYNNIERGYAITDSEGFFTIDFVTNLPDTNLLTIKAFGQDGNLYYETEQNERGLLYTDLKPALKLNKIVDAIERKYDITFSSTFLDSELFGRLFMWLHRKKGAMAISDGVTKSSIISGFQYVNGDDFVTFENGSFTLTVPTGGGTVEVVAYANYIITPASDKKYSVYIYLNGQLAESKTNVNGVTEIAVNLQEGENIVYAVIETTNGLTNYDCQLDVVSGTRSEDQQGNQTGSTGKSARYETLNASILSDIIITEQVPNMKVLDFMTNLFKMFNLTSYVKDDGSIYVETLDTFYSQYKNIDITNYTFVDEGTVDRALPYNKINLEFPEPKTFIAEKTNQLLGRKTRFGNLIYDGGTKFDGTDYTLTVDFEKMVYERLTDNGEPTNIGYGWFAKYNGDSSDDISNASPEIGKPLIFFNVKTDTQATPMSWASGHSQITTYNRPSNVSNADAEHPLFKAFTLNFGTEVDEYELSSNSNSIYNTFYKSYIQRVFNSKGRMFTFKAKLPQRVLLNYELNDVFIINGKQYIINSIDTDLMTGISSLQLINKLTESVATDLSNSTLFNDLNLIS